MKHDMGMTCLIVYSFDELVNVIVNKPVRKEAIEN